jgi:thiol-disulfide isomerase/thioredoxin
VSVTGLVVVVAVLVVATVVGLVMRSRAGRVRAGSGTSGGWAFAGTGPTDVEQVLLLQLSSPVCAPCRQTAGVLADVAGREPGVRHVEIDIAERPEVARSLAVMRTPTTIGFDRTGRELLRISGVPRRAELDAALAGPLHA